MDGIFAIELGTSVTCEITGFKGKVTARVEYDTGCRQYQVTPKAVKNETKENHWLDEVHLLASVPKPKKAKQKPGGYHPDPITRNHP